MVWKSFPIMMENVRWISLHNTIDELVEIDPNNLGSTIPTYLLVETKMCD